MTTSRSRDGVPRALKISNALCLAFANSAVPPPPDGRRRDRPSVPPDELTSYADLVAWGRRMGILGDRDGERLGEAAAADGDKARKVFARGLELRDALYRTFALLAGDEQARPEDLDLLTAVLRPALAARRLIAGDGGFRWETEGDPSALDRVLWPVAESAVELLTSGDHRRVRRCAGRDCRRLFLVRDRRRLWCDMNVCGSRVKGRRRRRYLSGIREDNELRLRARIERNLAARGLSRRAVESDED